MTTKKTGGSVSYEFYNLWFKNPKCFGVPNVWMTFIPFNYAWRTVRIFKKLMLHMIWRILCSFLVLYWQLDFGIISKMYFSQRFSYSFLKNLVSIPTPLLKGLQTWLLIFFSFNLPLKKPVRAKAALYL